MLDRSVDNRVLTNAASKQAPESDLCALSL